VDRTAGVTYCKQIGDRAAYAGAASSNAVSTKPDATPIVGVAVTLYAIQEGTTCPATVGG
jgi:hypothetical protein